MKSNFLAKYQKLCRYSSVSHKYFEIEIHKWNGNDSFIAVMSRPVAIAFAPLVYKYKGETAYGFPFYEMNGSDAEAYIKYLKSVRFGDVI